MAKSILVVLLSTMLSLALVESSLRLWVRNHGDGLQRALMVLRADSILGWRQKENLTTFFEGQELSTDAEGFRSQFPSQGTAMALVLGPSSTFGWGVGQSETYSALLQKHFRNSNPNVDVKNAGEIGFSLIQGRKLYSQIREKNNFSKIKFVVIAYGINDLDRFRFIGENGESDLAYFSSGDATITLPARFSLFTKSAFAALLLRAWNEVSIYRNCGLKAVPALRVSKIEFEKNLRDLVREVKESGATPILLNTAYHPKQNPKEDPSKSSNFYRQSTEASISGKCGLSRELLHKAKLAEPARIFYEVKSLNNTISTIARSEKIPLVDANKLLEDGEQDINFFDAVHPSALGHKKIAAQLIAVLPK